MALEVVARQTVMERPKRLKLAEGQRPPLARRRANQFAREQRRAAKSAFQTTRIRRAQEPISLVYSSQLGWFGRPRNKIMLPFFRNI
jgi:hypothetical protein